MGGYGPGEQQAGLGLLRNAIHPDDVARVSETFNRYMQGHLPKFEAEFRINRRSGETIWVVAREKDLTSRPVR